MQRIDERQHPRDRGPQRHNRVLEPIARVRITRKPALHRRKFLLEPRSRRRTRERTARNGQASRTFLRHSPGQNFNMLERCKPIAHATARARKFSRQTLHEATHDILEFEKIVALLERQTAFQV